MKVVLLGAAVLAAACSVLGPWVDHWGALPAARNDASAIGAAVEMRAALASSEVSCSCAPHL